MLPNVGSWEMIIILHVVFLVFGSKRLPDVARGLGRGLREFKREMRGITDELNSVSDDATRDLPKAKRTNASRNGPRTDDNAESENTKKASEGSVESQDAAASEDDSTK
jgi:TatA/E family protein of Tat protein translocase